MKVSGSIEFELIEQTSDKVVGRMPVQPGIQNPFGTVHAGATLWLADVCATVLAFGGAEMKVGPSGFPLAINLSANLLGNQKEGSLLATSVFVKKGKRLSVVRTTVTGEGGRLFAEMSPPATFPHSKRMRVRHARMCGLGSGTDFSTS
ncbi:MAG: PaaI family thioesterase [Gammaproteobacteria bacterium]